MVAITIELLKHYHFSLSLRGAKRRGNLMYPHGGLAIFSPLPPGEVAAPSGAAGEGKLTISSKQLISTTISLYSLMIYFHLNVHIGKI